MIQNRNRGKLMLQSIILYKFGPFSSSTNDKTLYSPYPFFSNSVFGIKRNAAELIQNFIPPLSLGPSSKTWPRCQSPYLLRTSVRIIP
jgi:hypothetical protein